MFGAVSPGFSPALETRGVTSSMRAWYSPSSKSSFVFLESLGSYFNMGYSFFYSAIALPPKFLCNRNLRAVFSRCLPPDIGCRYFSQMRGGERRKQVFAPPIRYPSASLGRVWMAFSLTCRGHLLACFSGHLAPKHRRLAGTEAVELL